MIIKVYIIVISYFLLGVIGFYFINRKKKSAEARKSWIKTLVYFIIINILCLSIIINPVFFRLLAILIIIMGFYELFGLFRDSGYVKRGFFLISNMVFALFSVPFFLFSGMGKELIFFSFATLSIFDSFSTITGQLWGRKKLFPKISPNKTTEGFIGGIIVAVLSAILMRGLIEVTAARAITIGAGVAVFAFIGDLSASYYKRKYNVKDFSSLIPEHGGFLDRFDSLIAGGAWITLLGWIVNNYSG